MNGLKKYGMIMITMILVLAIPLQAAGLKKVGQAGMKWMSIPIGARGAALGNAYTAIANDVSSMFWNPAGLAFTKGIHVFANRTQWIADINMNSAALSYNAGDWGVFGLSYVSMDWGTLHGTQRANIGKGYIETGDFSPVDWTVGLNYARKVSNSFSFGGHVHYISENLGTTYEGSFTEPVKYTAKMNLFSFDFGTYYFTGFKDLRLAMTLQNFSQEKEYRLEHFSLPLMFKFGAAMDILKFWTDSKLHTLTLSIDAVHPRDFSERMHFGLEYIYNKMFFLRSGYKYNYDEENLSFGAGLVYNIHSLTVTIDYSYIMFKNLGNVQMFSFDFSLD